jgi:hypothetical protein
LHRPPADRITRFAHNLGNLVPDATSSSVILLLIVVGVALAFGNSPGAVMDAYYRGLWMLLPFTMQMTLILVLSAVASDTRLFRRIVVALAQKPRTLTQIIAISVVLDAALSYFLLGPRSRTRAAHCDPFQRGSGREGHPGGLSIPARHGGGGPIGLAVRALGERAPAHGDARSLPREHGRRH